MAMPRPCFFEPGFSADWLESSARTSMCHCPHSSTSGVSACAWQARRPPRTSSSAENAERSCSVTGSDPARTRTLQPPQRPFPPHGNSKPGCDIAEKSGSPRGTSTTTDNGSNLIPTLAPPSHSPIPPLQRGSRPTCHARSCPEPQRENQPHPTLRGRVAVTARENPVPLQISILTSLPQLEPGHAVHLRARRR